MSNTSTAVSPRQRKSAGALLRENLSLLMLALILIGFALATPDFLSLHNLKNVCRQVAPLLVASLGQLLIVLVGGIDISTGALVALGSVTAALVAEQYGVACGFAAGIMAALVCGYFSGIAVSIFQVQPVVATIGMLSIARGLAFTVTNGNSVDKVPPGFSWLGSAEILGVPASVVVAAALTAGVALMLRATPFGRALFAIGGNEDAARASGIPTTRYKPLAYALGAALAGVAGIMFSSRAGSGQPTMGFGLELETIAAVVLGGTALGGGRARVVGVVAGAFMVGVLANGMNLAGVSPYVQRIVLGLAIVALFLLNHFAVRHRMPGFAALLASK
jgi:ribose transport system permease protein